MPGEPSLPPLPTVFVVADGDALADELRAAGHAIAGRAPRAATTAAQLAGVGLIAIEVAPGAGAATRAFVAALGAPAPVVLVCADAADASADDTALTRPYEPRLLATTIALARARHDLATRQARALRLAPRVSWSDGGAGDPIASPEQRETQLALAHFAIEHAVEAFHLVDRHARFHAVNEASCRLLGYSRAELLRMTVHDIDPQFPVAAWEAHWADVASHGALTLETTVVGKDGRAIAVEVTVNHLAFDGEEFVFTVMRDISERRRAEAALHASDDRYRSLFAAAIRGIFRTDLQGTIVDANPAFARLCGHEQAEALVGTNLSACFADAEDMRRVRDLVLASDHEVGQELIWRKRDGERMVVEFEARVVRDPRGAPQAFQGLVRDVTTQQQHAAALRVLSTGLTHRAGQALFDELTAQLAAIVGADLAFLGATHAGPGLRLLSLVLDGRPLVATDPLPASVAEIVRAEGGHRVIAIDTARAGLGAAGYVAAPLCDEAGQPIGQIGVMTRRAIANPAPIASIVTLFAARAGAELVQLRAVSRFTSVFEFAPDALLISDEGGGIVLANRMAEKTLGYTREALTRLRVEDLVPVPLRARHAAFHREFLANARTGAMALDRPRLTALRQDGTIVPVEINLSPFQSDEGTRVVIAIRDLTELTRIERERTLLESHLRRAQKLEALGTLAGGIAHDFNNLLAAIIANVELADESPNKDANVSESLAEIASAAARASELVRQILTFSRQQSSARTATHLRGLIEDAARMLRALLPAAIRIALELDAGSPMVLIDPIQIHGVIVNLGTNAWHAIERGTGTITIRLDTVQASAGGGTPAGLAPGKYARLQVQDDGKGMDAATLERIFEPFFTTKGVGHGTGLGLAMAHGVVTDHGGAITVASAVGRGTTFAIYLPELPAARRSGDAPAAAAIPRGAGHVLLIDDDELVMRSTCRQLELLGYTVAAFADARAALAAAEAAPDLFDVVITDLHMPELGGLELARALGAIRPTLPIILISGNQARTEAELAAANVRDHLAKPFTRAMLAEALGRALAR
ncbi:MAG: PAS domain S-box protein [Deltaproteobacteria bacterium]|nr:PAS domain S-box protein [Deltaproteobacteria bacterium]